METYFAGLLQYFSTLAYQPLELYGMIILFMVASSFGFPIPEELVLVSAGLMAYMVSDTNKFPPPYEGAEGINVITLCLVCFFAVFLSDLLVFLIGKFFGTKIIKTDFFQKRFAGPRFEKMNSFFLKYGSVACGVFRFTPGLRFPGHLSCGILGIALWKFILVDGLAALISVPTQVYFVSRYGEEILQYFKEIKLVLLILIGLYLIYYFIKKKEHLKWF